MPTFTKLKSGSWRVQVRKKREYVANTFIRRRDAEEWAIEIERSIDRGTPIRRSKSHEHAAAVHGIEVSVENVQLARAALKHLDLVGKSNERDRRPTQDELNQMIEYAGSNPQQFLPLGRIIRFAVAPAMRQAEICRIEWSDVDMTKQTVTIRDRKDPRRKDGNHQVVPLLNSTGYGAWQLVLEQRIVTRGIGRVFPYHPKSVGAAFHRSCKKINLDDLCFHDLRHEVQAGSLKLASRYSKSPWSRAIKIGACSGVTRTSSLKTCTKCRKLRNPQ